MKVVQIVPRMESGGVERGTVEVASSLVKNSHDAIVISEGGAMVEELDRLGVRHERMSVARKSPASIKGIGQIAGFLAREQVDIVHCRSRLPAWLTLFALRKIGDKRPRFVTSVHGLHSVSRYSSVIGRGELVEAVSNTAREYLLQNYPKVDQSRVRVIYRGIDPAQYHSEFSPSDSWMKTWNQRMLEFNPDAEPILTLAGRISRLKGHEEFLSVLEQLNETGFACRGLIAGSEDPRHRRYARTLHRRITQSKLLKDRVWFTGQRTDVREVFSVSSCVLSLSTKPESFGRTVLEALSLGTPVVAFDHGGVGEILKQLFPFGTVKFGDISAVANRVVDICRSHHAVEPHEMTLEKMCARTIAMYEELAT